MNIPTLKQERLLQTETEKQVEEEEEDQRQRQKIFGAG
jgi:hypothetical protein